MDLRTKTVCRRNLVLLLVPLLFFVFPLRGAESPPPIEAFFSPKGGCTAAIVNQIHRARTLIRVQAYSFTSAPIAQALVEAHQRGVQVQVILDRSQENAKYSSAKFLEHAGVTTLIDDRHAIAHNKVMVIDDEVLITGSFNFTKAAEENNAENLLILRDKALAARFTRNWEEHLKHSRLE